MGGLVHGQRWGGGHGGVYRGRRVGDHHGGWVRDHRGRRVDDHRAEGSDDGHDAHRAMRRGKRGNGTRRKVILSPFLPFFFFFS